jgi:hypothetical protein
MGKQKGRAELQSRARSGKRGQSRRVRKVGVHKVRRAAGKQKAARRKQKAAHMRAGKMEGRAESRVCKIGEQPL